MISKTKGKYKMKLSTVPFKVQNFLTHQALNLGSAKSLVKFLGQIDSWHKVQSNGVPLIMAVGKTINPTKNMKKMDHHGVWKSQKKVSFNIASEASFVYILSGQKLI